MKLIFQNVRIFNWYIVKKNEKLRKAEALNLVHELDINIMDLFTKWHDMLQLSKKIKLITGNSETEVETKYREFLKSLHNDGRGRLGSIWSIDKVNSSSSGIIIPYTIFDLKEGISEQDYFETISKYDELQSKHDMLVQKFKLERII